MNNYVKITPDGNITFVRQSNIELIRKASAFNFVELNLIRVPLIDSCGLDTIVEVRKRIEKNNGELRIINAHGGVADLLRLFHIQHVSPTEKKLSFSC